MHHFILCLGVARGSAYFGQGTGSIMLDDLGCTGSEATLTNCSYSSAHNCYHFEDVGVSCSRKIMCVCVCVYNIFFRLQSRCVLLVAQTVSKEGSRCMQTVHGAQSVTTILRMSMLQ